RGALAAHAVVAEATADMGGDHHAVTLADGDDGRPDLLHDAQRLMTDDHPIDLTHAPLVDVQIRPADRGGRESQEHIGRCLEAGILHRLDIHRPVASPDNGLHCSPPRMFRPWRPGRSASVTAHPPCTKDGRRHRTRRRSQRPFRPQARRNLWIPATRGTPTTLSALLSTWW